MKLPVTGRPAPDPDPAGSPGRAFGGELRALTGLRIVAALWVVAFHFHFTALPGVVDANELLGPLVAQGALGVDLFFVLSGFVIAHTYLDRMGPRLRLRSAGRFVWARAGRMWPAYLVVFHVFGIWLLVRATYGSDPDIAFQAVQPELTWGQWLRQLVLVQMWDRPFLDGASWVGPTWSISAEWLAYLLFPLTALVFFRLRRLPVVVLGFGALLAMAPMAAAFVVLGTPYYPFSWLVRVLCGFSAGVLTLLAVRKLAGSRRARRAAPATAAVAGTGIVVGLLAGDAAGGGLFGLVTLLFPVLVGALALEGRGPARWLGSRPMVHGGRISYALYLVHIPMFEMLWLALRHGAGGRFDGLLVPGSVSAHVVALVVLVATVPVAHLLYAFVEQPARTWMRDLPTAWRRRAPVPAAPDPVVRPDAGRPAPATSDADRPYDSERARLDPPTMLVPVVPAAREDLTVVLPLVDVPTVPAPAVAPPSLPRQSGPVDPVPVLARLHAARESGHGDDHEGDGLAGNLMAAARLRSAGTGSGEADHDRSDAVRRAARSSLLTAPRVPSPTSFPDGDGDVPVPGPADGAGRDRIGRRDVDGDDGRDGSGSGGADRGGADRGDAEQFRGDAEQLPGDAEPFRAGRGGAGRYPVGEDGVERNRVRRRRTDQYLAGRDDADRDRPTDHDERSGAGRANGDRAGVPAPRTDCTDRTGSRSGAERCGRSRNRHRAHGSAATPIVATAAASVRGRRRPAHGQHHRGD